MNIEQILIVKNCSPTLVKKASHNYKRCTHKWSYAEFAEARSYNALFSSTNIIHLRLDYLMIKSETKLEKLAPRSNEDLTVCN